MEHEPLVRRVLNAYVIFASDPDSPLPSNDEISQYVDTMMRHNAIDVRAIDNRETSPFDHDLAPVHVYSINFYDDCDITIVVFVDDDQTPTHAMISADMQPYLPMHI